MGPLAKLLFLVVLLLPGGFVVGPAWLAIKRWRLRRAQLPATLPSAP